MMFPSEKLATVAVILCRDENVSAIGSKAKENGFERSSNVTLSLIVSLAKV